MEPQEHQQVLQQVQELEVTLVQGHPGQGWDWEAQLPLGLRLPSPIPPEASILSEGNSETSQGHSGQGCQR